MHSGVPAVMNLVGRPEAELLLCCASTGNFDGRIRELLEIGVDWNIVAAMAERHKITPLLYRRLSRVAPDLLVRPELAPIVQKFMGIVGRNLYLTKELLSLLDLLKQNGIPAISFKGPLLAVDAFGDVALREFGDLDLLLRPAHMREAKRLLELRGYRPEIKMGV